MTRVHSHLATSEQGAAKVSEMTPHSDAAHRPTLSGFCPDSQRCRLASSCWDLCSRLQATEITVVMQAHARALSPAQKKVA